MTEPPKKLQETGMYRDVMQQPDCWDALMRRDLRDWQKRVGAARNGLLLGMGASRYAALAAHLSMAAAGRAWHIANADDVLHYFGPRVPFDAVLAISQSGESADTVAAAEKLKASGAPIMSVTNDSTSRLATLSEYPLDLGFGEEMGSATKTYTGSVLALLASDAARVPELTKLPEQAAEILGSLKPGDVPDLLRPERSHYFLGSGPNYATALGAALLCKEKLFLTAEGFGTAEFAHGPLEALNERSTVWLFSEAARMEELLLPLAKRIVQTGAQLVVTGEGTAAYSGAGIQTAWAYDISLHGPADLGTLLYILPMHLMVLWEADRRGYPIDTFRRMDKVLTGYDYGL